MELYGRKMCPKATTEPIWYHDEPINNFVPDMGLYGPTTGASVGWASGGSGERSVWWAAGRQVGLGAFRKDSGNLRFRRASISEILNP